MEATSTFNGAAPGNGGAEGGPKEKKTARYLWMAIVALLVLAGVAFGVLCYVSSNSHEIYPNTYVVGINIGGMSQAEAMTALKSGMEETYRGKSLTLHFPNGKVEISSESIAPDIDEAVAAEAAYRYGRERGVLAGAITYLKALFSDNQMQTDFYVDEVFLDQMLADAAEHNDVEMLLFSYVAEENRILITKGRAGRAIDKAALYDEIKTAFENRIFDSITCVLDVAEPKPLDLNDLRNQLHIEPADAYFDGEAHEIVEHVTGVDFDVAKAQELLDKAKAGEVVAIELILTEPNFKTQALEELLFRNIMGECTTSVGGTAARINNVKIAATCIDGKILMPGEVFSYNETVGKRTADKGFRDAPAYINGLTVNTIGGGICQVSSTLYLATMRSNLEIVTRYAHTYRVAYVPYGMDATVSWGGPDYEFQNNTEYPIKITVENSNKTLTIKIYGTKSEDTSVKIEYKILSTMPYETIEKQVDTLAPGEMKVDVTGYTGYKVETYRCVYDADGTLISREFEAASNYKKRDKIVLVGPAKAIETAVPNEEPVVEPIVIPLPEASAEVMPTDSGGETTVTPEPGGIVTDTEQIVLP